MEKVVADQTALNVSEKVSTKKCRKTSFLTFISGGKICG